MIEVRKLEKSFGEEKVLNAIDLTIDDGEIFGIVGRSGVGKSTLLRCINALETYDAGSLRVDGVEVREMKGRALREFRRGVGMVFQQFSLIERDTVYGNVALPLKSWGYDKAEIDRKVHELLSIVELDDRAGQKARQLSGGQKQRVAIARALALEPTILLCDEATSALDPKTTKSILELLKGINRELGITIVVVTHEMSVVRGVCDRLAVLDRDGVAALGSVEEVFKDQCETLQELLGNRADYGSVDSGCVMRFFYNQEKLGFNPIVDLSRSMDVDFTVLNADVQSYRSGIMGEYTLLVASDEADRIARHLESRGMFWEVLNS